MLVGLMLSIKNLALREIAPSTRASGPRGLLPQELVNCEREMLMHLRK